MADFNRWKIVWPTLDEMLNMDLWENIYLWHSEKGSSILNPYPADWIKFVTPISDCQPIR